MSLETLSVKDIFELVILFASFLTAIGVITKKLNDKIKEIAVDGTKDEIGKEIKEAVKDGFQEQAKSTEEIKSSITKQEKNLAEVSNKVDLLGKATQDSIRQSIMKVHEETVSKGEIDSNRFYMVTQLFSDYQNLGGNSFIVDLYGEIQDIYNNPKPKKRSVNNGKKKNSASAKSDKN